MTYLIRHILFTYLQAKLHRSWVCTRVDARKRFAVSCMQGTPKKPRLDTDASVTKGSHHTKGGSGDRIVQLSHEYWVGENTKPFDPKVIEDVFTEELKSKRVSRLMALELSMYLEK